MPKETHEVRIRVDKNEHTIINWCKRAWPHGTNLIDWSHPLRYGDIQIMVDGMTDLVIERKAPEDFRSSVASKDQRFRRQRANLILLQRKYPGVRVMYLLEGDLRELCYDPNDKFSLKYLLDRQEELSSKYGIPIHREPDVAASVMFIIRLWTRATKHGSIERVCAKVREDETNALGQEKFRPDVEERAEKGENPRKFLQKTLVGLYGMTVDKALCIVNRYHTLENMLHCYRRLKVEKQRCNMLAKLRPNKESKRIGPVLSKRVYACLIGLDSGEDFKPIPITELDTEEN